MAIQPHTGIVTITVRTADPIEGSVAGADGRNRRFTGWLGLISALQDALSGARADDGGERPAPGSGDGR